MRTPAEWWRKYPPRQAYEWIEMIQSDARAGMVPEGELAELKGRHAGLWATVEGLKTDIESLKAELAKAWEAGRDAAAAECGDSNAAPLARIRALQPPGGKAK